MLSILIQTAGGTGAKGERVPAGAETDHSTEGTRHGDLQAAKSDSLR